MSNENTVGDYFYPRNLVSANRGPCGIPRNAFGISPYMAGMVFQQNFCRSDIEDCKRCPLNPNIKNGTPEE